MTKTAIVPKHKPMSMGEAEEFLKRIKSGFTLASARLSKVRELLVEFDEREGWKVCGGDDDGGGYDDVFHCLDDRLRHDLGWTKTQVYRVLKSARTEQRLIGVGEASDAILKDEGTDRPIFSERVLREAGRLDDRPQEQVRAVRNAARAAEGGRLTARHVKNEVDRILSPRVSENSEDAVIIERGTALLKRLQNIEQDILKLVREDVSVPVGLLLTVFNDLSHWIDTHR